MLSSQISLYIKYSHIQPSAKCQYMSCLETTICHLRGGLGGYNDFFFFWRWLYCGMQLGFWEELKGFTEELKQLFFPVHSSALSILHCSGCELRKPVFGKRSCPAGFIIGLSEWGHSQIFFGNSVGKDQSPLSHLCSHVCYSMSRPFLCACCTGRRDWVQRRPV